jgi:dienelactone hydrolase
MWNIVAGLFGGVLLLALEAHAQFARQQVIPFESATVSPSDFLTGKKGTPITVAGHLRLPNIKEKQPAVVLMHAATLAGGNAHLNEWSRVLNEAGIATFVVDSFSPRGVTAPADLGRITPLARMVDAFRALELLSKHPLIDANRIAIMGFSHGGSAALYSGMVRFQRLQGSPDARFAAHISVYGGCATAYHEDEVLDHSPVLLLHGASDDWAPAEPCREYAARLVKAGMNARFIAYPGAYHVFDSPDPERIQLMKFPQVSTGGTCRYSEVNGGTIVNVATEQPPSPSDTCLGKGATTQYNEAAAQKAHEDVLAFLNAAFAQR